MVTISIVNKIKRYFFSLRFFVVAIIIFVGMVPVILISSLVMISYYNREVDSRQSAVMNECVTLGNQILSEGYMSQKQGDLTLAMEMTADIYDGRILIVNPDYLIVTDTYRIYEGRYCISKEVINGFAGKTYTNINRNDHYIEYIYPITDSNSGGVMGVLVMSASTTILANHLQDIRHQINLIWIVLLVLLLVASFLTARWLEKPFKYLLEQLAVFNEGEIDMEVSADGFTELVDINEGYSGAIRQLRELDQSRQEFVSNVSHELKTPITSVKVMVDSLLSMEGIPEEIYREFLTDISGEINRESEIISDLLDLVRLDKGASSLKVQPININGILEMNLKRLKPIAATRNIELVFETFRDVVAEIDEVKMSLAIMNVVENAIKYNRDNGQVRVSLNADHIYFYVKITDTGVGIPEDEMEKIFNRFYRVDKARSRDTGGTGLGLAITKRIVVMHKGTITVSSVYGEGTTFTIRVPLMSVLLDGRRSEFNNENETS